MLHDQLQRLIPCISHLEQLLKEMTDEQYNYKLSASSWSIGECVEHLKLASAGYYPGIKAGVEKAIKEGKTVQRPFTRNLVGKVLHWAVDPQSRWPIPSPGKFKPTASQYRKENLKHYLAQLALLKGYIEQSTALPLDEIKVTSPITSLIKMQLGDVYEMLIRHCRRHIQQMEKVRETQHFPK